MMSDEIKRPFGRSFLIALAAAVLRSPVHANRVAALVDPRWVADETLGEIIHTAVDYVKKYRTLPTMAVMEEECGKDIVNSPVFKKVMKRSMRDAEYTASKLTAFCRNAALTEAVLTAATLIRQGKEDKVPSIIQAANRVGLIDEDIGEFWSDWRNRLPEYAKVDHLGQSVPTGWSHVDKCLRGGLGKGELGVIVAATGVGKSHALTDIGANAARAGYKVVHYTFELRAKKLLARYDRNHVPFAASLMQEAPKDFIRKATKTFKMFPVKGESLTYFKPTKSFTVSMMRAHLDRAMMQKEYRPDLICVDYADIMKPETRLGEVRHEQAGIYEELRGLAGEYDIPIWTASQTNKLALSKKVVRIEDVAESFEKMKIADAVITICETPEEKHEGRCRLFFAKMRDSADAITFTAAFDKSTSRFVTDGIYEPEPIKKSKSLSRGPRATGNFKSHRPKGGVEQA